MMRAVGNHNIAMKKADRPLLRAEKEYLDARDALRELDASHPALSGVDEAPPPPPPPPPTTPAVKPAHLELPTKGLFDQQLSDFHDQTPQPYASAARFMALPS